MNNTQYGITWNLRYLLVVLLTLLLFLPKVNLLMMSQGTTGLRIDDMVLLFASFIFAIPLLSGKKVLGQMERRFYSFFVLSLCSFSLNWFLFRWGWTSGAPNILFALRMLEYFCFFYCGTFAVEFFRLKHIVFGFLFVNIFLIILQKFGLVGGFTVNGYQGFLSMPIGVTAGNWELGFLLSVIYALILFSKELKESFILPKMTLHSTFINLRVDLNFVATFTLFVLLALFVGSRSLALCIILISVAKFLEGQSILKILLSAGVCFVLGSSLIYAFNFADDLKDFALIRRSQALFTWKNIELFWKIFEQMDVKNMAIEDSYSGLHLDKYAEYDLSWYIRAHKWCFVIKQFLSNPVAYLFGLGPGYCLGALDGGHLRLLAENGLLGYLAYFRFFTGSKEKSIQAITFVLAAYMLFIDIYLAYKAMSVCYFVIAMILSRDDYKNFTAVT